MRAEASPLGGFTEDNRLARKMGLWFALAGIALLVLGLFGAARREKLEISGAVGHLVGGRGAQALAHRLHAGAADAIAALR